MFHYKAMNKDLCSVLRQGNSLSKEAMIGC